MLVQRLPPSLKPGMLPGCEFRSGEVGRFLAHLIHYLSHQQFLMKGFLNCFSLEMILPKQLSFPSACRPVSAARLPNPRGGMGSSLRVSLEPVARCLWPPLRSRDQKGRIHLWDCLGFLVRFMAFKLVLIASLNVKEGSPHEPLMAFNYGLGYKMFQIFGECEPIDRVLQRRIGTLWRLVFARFPFAPLSPLPSGEACLNKGLVCSLQSIWRIII